MKIMLKTLAIGLATLLAVGCGSSPEPSAGCACKYAGHPVPRLGH